MHSTLDHLSDDALGHAIAFLGPAPALWRLSFRLAQRVAAIRLERFASALRVHLSRLDPFSDQLLSADQKHQAAWPVGLLSQARIFAGSSPAVVEIVDRYWYHVQPVATARHAAVLVRAAVAMLRVAGVGLGRVQFFTWQENAAGIVARQWRRSQTNGTDLEVLLAGHSPRAWAPNVRLTALNVQGAQWRGKHRAAKLARVLDRLRPQVVRLMDDPVLGRDAKQAVIASARRLVIGRVEVEVRLGCGLVQEEFEGEAKAWRCLEIPSPLSFLTHAEFAADLIKLLASPRHAELELVDLPSVVDFYWQHSATLPPPMLMERMTGLRGLVMQVPARDADAAPLRGLLLALPDTVAVGLIAPHRQTFDALLCQDQGRAARNVVAISRISPATLLSPAPEAAANPEAPRLVLDGALISQIRLRMPRLCLIEFGHWHDLPNRIAASFLCKILRLCGNLPGVSCTMPSPVDGDRRGLMGRVARLAVL